MANKPKRYEIKDNMLVIRVPISPVRSKSGKSTLLFTTRGRESFEHEGKDVFANINIYVMTE